MNIADTITANSDQINADDLIGGPMTVTIKLVSRGKTEQPIDITLHETDKLWRPCKTVRRVLVAAWTTDATTWPGNRATLYRDPTVTWGGEAIGGIRVSHISGIPKPLNVALSVKRGKRLMHTVQPLQDDPHAALRIEWMTATPERRTEIEGIVNAT